MRRWGAFLQKKAEIIPVERRQVMLPTEKLMLIFAIVFILFIKIDKNHQLNEVLKIADRPQQSAFFLTKFSFLKCLN